MLCRCGLGLAFPIFLRAQSYENISMIGLYPYRLAIAERLDAGVIQFKEGYSRELQKLGGIAICIMAARAQETFKDSIPLMNKNGAVYHQTYVSDGDILKMMREKKILLGRAFAYFMDDVNQLKNLIKKNKIGAEIMVTKRIASNDLVGCFNQLLEKLYLMKLWIVYINVKDQEH